MNLAFAHVQRHLATIMIVGALVTTGLAPTRLSMPVIIFWLIAGAGCVVFVRVGASNVRRKFGGTILAFVQSPTPIDSLIGVMEQRGISVAGVKTFSMMSADVAGSIAYYQRTDHTKKHLNEILDDCPNTSVVIYGPPDEVEPILPHERMSIIRISERTTEHTNLITMRDGRFFVWYEPFHEIVNGRNYFTRGAYLVAINAGMAFEIQKSYAAMARDYSTREEWHPASSPRLVSA